MGTISTRTFRPLGKLLAKGRQRAGFSQGKVAIKLGYTSAQFISNIERGRCAPPLSKLKRMVDLYGLPPDEIQKVILEGTQKELRSALC